MRLPSDHVTRRIFSAAMLVAAATIAAKVVSMFKEMIVASSFGTGDAMDAYLVAFTIPAYIINVAAGSLNVALIPTYIETRARQGAESGRDLLASALVLNLFLLLILAGAISFLAPSIFPLITKDFGPQKSALSLQLFAVLVPCVLISGISVTLQSVLNAEEHFFGVGLSSALIPVGIVLAVVLGGSTLGAYALAIGTLGGYALELLSVLYLIRKNRIAISFRWKGFHPQLKSVLHQYLPAVSGSSLMCSAILIDQSMSASLGSGNIAALSYGNKLVAVLLGAVTVALGTAVLPYFSTMAAARDWKALRETLNHYVLLILACTVPCTLVFIYCSEILVRLLFQRGAFSAEDTVLVGQVQAVLAAQIPFHTLGILFVRLLSSLKLNSLMFVSNIISVVLNISLNYVFMQYWGLIGIALSTVLVYVAAAVFMGIVVYRRLAANLLGAG